MMDVDNTIRGEYFDRATGVWDIKTKDPFFVFFRDAETRHIFMSEYTPTNGFGILQAIWGYRVYTNTYVYKALKFVNSDKELIGIIISQATPMKQRDTLGSAVKRVQVVNLKEEYFCVKGERSPRILRNGAVQFFACVDGEDWTKQAGTEDEDENEKQLEFLTEHEEIISCKKEYEEAHLFAVPYAAFEDSLQNVQDGVIYKFDVTALDEDEYQDRFTENVGVEVSSNDGGFPVTGTVIEYSDGWLYIKFHNIAGSYDRIAKSGEIKERSNPEYAFKLDALESLKKDLSPNKYLLSILADRKVKPYTITKHYYPFDVTEKDGSVHKNVNPSQKDAIEKALNVDDFLLVQGPPGTGKTTIITEMIEDFVRQGLRVLICSKNNLAVDNVLEKCQGLYYDEARTKKMQCLRLGNEEKVLPAVRGSLPRPLTMKIQDDVKAHSQVSRERYLTNVKEAMELYTRANEVTEVLSEVAKSFLVKKEFYQTLLQDFTNSPLTILIGLSRRAAFVNNLHYLIEETDLLAAELVELMMTESVKLQATQLERYLRIARNIYSASEDMPKFIMNAPMRFSFILKRPSSTVLEDFTNVVADKQNEVISICNICKYRGNPAAPLIKSDINMGVLSSDAIDRYRQNTKQQIAKLRNKKLLLSEVLDEWHRELESDQSSLEEPLLRTVRIIGATCIGVNTKKNFKDVEYDVAIVDEAGQITLHDLLVPLVKARKIILIGDHLQLPPSAEADFCQYVQDNDLLGFDELEDREEIRQRADELDRVFSVSLFEQLFRDRRFNSNRVMLDTQFRMHPDIATFISDNFYEGKYKSGVSAAARTLKIADFDRPMYFIDTCNSSRKYEDKNPDPTVHVNTYEAEICASYLARIIVAIENNEYEPMGKKLKTSDGGYDIGVITAYKKQIAIIRRELKKRLLKFYDKERVDNIVMNLAINTLDSFQGRDNQIIFYSFVRCNKEHKIGFLNEVRRLNVMMTRAKSLLVMIGDSETLTMSRSRTIHDGKRASEYYGALVEYCKDKNGYIDYANEV